MCTPSSNAPHVLAGMGCLFNSQGVSKSKMASHVGKHILVRISLRESDSDVEEVTGTEPHEALTTTDHLDNDTEGNDEGDRLDPAPKPDNDSGPVIPPSEGGLTEDALLVPPMYTGDDDDDLDGR